jgi:4-hydroxybenzoate polyprenyltransferase
MACYAVLALVGAVALDGILRAAVLCLFAILAVKTVIHAIHDEEMP